MRAGGHQPQCLGIVPVFVNGCRHGLDFPAGKQFQAVLRDVAHQRRIITHQPIDIDGRKTQVLSEYSKTQRRVSVDVNLADLQMLAAGPKRAETQIDMVSGQRIEDDVNTFTGGFLHQLIVPVMAV